MWGKPRWLLFRALESKGERKKDEIRLRGDIGFLALISRLSDGEFETSESPKMELSSSVLCVSSSTDLGEGFSLGQTICFSSEETEFSLGHLELGCCNSATFHYLENYNKFRHFIHSATSLRLLTFNVDGIGIGIDVLRWWFVIPKHDE